MTKDQLCGSACAFDVCGFAGIEIGRCAAPRLAFLECPYCGEHIDERLLQTLPGNSAMERQENSLKQVAVHDATHVKTQDGRIERIASKWGVDAAGHLAKPSEGGFGVVTVSGERIGMMSAHSYWK